MNLAERLSKPTEEAVSNTKQVSREQFAMKLRAVMKSDNLARSIYTKVPEGLRHAFADLADDTAVLAGVLMSRTFTNITLDDLQDKLSKIRYEIGALKKLKVISDGKYRREINFINTFEHAVFEMLKGFNNPVIATLAFRNSDGKNGDVRTNMHQDGITYATPLYVITGAFWGPSTVYREKDGTHIKVPDESLCGHLSSTKGAHHASPDYRGLRRVCIVISFYEMMILD